MEGDKEMKNYANKSNKRKFNFKVFAFHILLPLCVTSLILLNWYWFGEDFTTFGAIVWGIIFFVAGVSICSMVERKDLE